MGLAVSRQFLGPGPYLQSARSAVEAHASAAPVVLSVWAVVDVVHISDVHVVVGAVVVEMPAAPVAALIAKADVAKAVIDATVVADVRAPVATVKPVMVMPVTPVAGRPECPLIGSLHPHAGHPVITGWSPCPVAGRPQVAVAGSLRLVVVGQGRRRLRRVVNWLSAVAGIIRALVIALVGGLVVSSARFTPRSALLGAVICGRRGVRVGRDRGQVGRRRVRGLIRGLILRSEWAGVARSRILTLGASDGKQYYRHGKQRQSRKSGQTDHFNLQSFGYYPNRLV